MAQKSYLFAVQRLSGHEVVSATVETDKVSSVTAERDKSGHVVLKHGSDKVASSADSVDEGEELALHRWPSDDKLAEPVSRPV